MGAIMMRSIGVSLWISSGRWIVLQACCALVSVLLCPDLRASSYYVSTLGDDGNDGSVGAPWGTIAHALEQAAPGDSVILREGVFNQQVETVRAGEHDAPITVMSYGAERAIIDGTGTGFGNGVLIGHDYISVVGLTVRNWESTGIWLQAGAGNVVVRRCEVYDCGAGIDIYEGVHDFVIDSVDLHDFAEESHGLDATSHDGTPIYNGLISNSRSHDGKGGNCDGFALGHVGQDDPHFYASFDDIRSVRFVACQAYNVGDGFDISGRGIVLERCLAHHTFYGGNYKLWASDPVLIDCIGYDGGANVELDVQESPPVHATLYNCTFFDGRENNIWIQTDSCLLQMYNCIVAGGNNVGIRTEEPFSSAVYQGDHNIFHCGNPDRMFADPDIDLSLQDFQDGKWRQISGQDVHSIVVLDVTTLFIDTNAASIDLHLKDTAPAIDAGTTGGAAPAVDFDGMPRDDSKIDIGAYEYRGSLGIESVSTEGAVLLCYPDIARERAAVVVRCERSGHIRLALFDAIGREVVSIFDGMLNAEGQRFTIDLSRLPIGIYYCVLDDGLSVTTTGLAVTER